MKFEGLKSSGRSVVSAIYTPLEGPFIVTSQFDDRFLKMPWGDAKFISSREGLLTNRFDLKIGQQIFQKGENNLAELCAYFYDTGG